MFSIHNSRASISGKSYSLFGFGMRRSRTHPFLHITRCLKLRNVFSFLLTFVFSSSLCFPFPFSRSAQSLQFSYIRSLGSAGAYWAYFNSLDRSVEALLWAFYFLYHVWAISWAYFCFSSRLLNECCSLSLFS